MTREQKDRRIKEGVRRQMRSTRKNSADQADGARSENRRNMDARRQTNAAKELRSSGTSATYQDDAEDKAERRHQWDLAEQDRRIKEGVRRQTQAANELQSSGTSVRYEDDADDEAHEIKFIN